MTAVTDPVAEPRAAYLLVNLAQLRPSRLNPAGRMKSSAVEDIAGSIRDHGVLQPILIRPVSGATPYEIVAGHRRVAAAALVGLEAVPATVRTLSDEEALELQLVENVQRANLHPLEEAQGYFQLDRLPGYDIAKIADRVGRSQKYIYDRLKLLSLTKEAQEAFLEDRFTAGHAILLARLSPADQARAMDPDIDALFESENAPSLFAPDDVDEHAGRDIGVIDDPLKPRSVREFESWINDHVRFDPAAIDVPDLFPETAATVASAQEAKEKIVHITHEHHIADETRSSERTFGPRSWKRADGVGKSKECDKSVLGIVAVGAGRGEAFRVCISKTCDTHWPQEARAKKRHAAGAKPSQKESDQARYERQRQESMAQQKVEEAARAAWKKAAPTMIAAVAAKVEKAPTSAKGHLGAILLSFVKDHLDYGSQGPSVATKLMPSGKTADTFVRHLVMVTLADLAGKGWDSARKEFTTCAKSLGVDVARILAGEPVEKKVQTSANVKSERPTGSSEKRRNVARAKKGTRTKPYTAEQKALVVKYALSDGLTAVQVHQKYGVSPRTYYEWRAAAAKSKSKKAKKR